MSKHTINSFIYHVILITHEKLRYFYTSRSYDKKIWRTIIIMLLVFVSPIIALCLILALMYKLICFMIIKWEDQNFVEFLDSFDVFWSLEDDKMKSIINALGVVETDCPENLINCIGEKLLKVSDTKGDKIFYRRTEKYGFYYWRKPEFIDMKEYIQLLDIRDICSYLNVNDLEVALKDIANRALPFKGEGMFQIFITKQSFDGGESKGKYALICRVHHSLGDGITIIQFLCQTLADDMTSDTSFIKMSESYKNDTNKSAGDLMQMMKKLGEILIVFASCLQRQPDYNSLHGPKLSGESIFKWTDEDENLYIMVKAIKDSVEGVSFTDVILAALSQSLQNYYLKTMDRIPEHVAVIIPVRHANARRDLELENNFSVNLLDLPINGNLEDIGKLNKRLRESVDWLVNSGCIKLCSILPNNFLEPLMDSKYASMSFSNMPGPKELSICGGNRLMSLVFFAPHRGSTGFSLTALFYGGVLRLAASVDSALISRPRDLGLLLDDTVAAIKQLHAQYANK